MKKIYLVTFICFLALIPNASLGATKNVTIDWTMTDTTNVQSFKMYYSYNDDMANKIWHQDCNDPTEKPAGTFSMTCNNVNIEHYPIYFTIAAVITGDEINSPPKEKQIAISVIQNFQILTTGDNAAPTALITVNTTEGTAPLTVSFDASGSSDTDGTINSYSWNFGDGDIGTGTNLSHTFSTVGSYPVVLTVTDDKGATAQNNVIINVTDPQQVTPEIIGNETQYSDGRHIMSTSIVAYKLPETPLLDGTLQSISVSLSGLGTTKHVRFAIYTHDPANDLPESIVTDAITVEGTISSNSGTYELVTLDIKSGTPQITAGTQYWIVLQSTDNWTSFGTVWNTSAKIAYKEVSAYNWEPWHGSASDIRTYKIGACYFSYVPIGN